LFVGQTAVAVLHFSFRCHPSFDPPLTTSRSSPPALSDLIFSLAPGTNNSFGASCQAIETLQCSSLTSHFPVDPRPFPLDRPSVAETPGPRKVDWHLRLYFLKNDRFFTYLFPGLTPPFRDLQTLLFFFPCPPLSLV